MYSTYLESPTGFQKVLRFCFKSAQPENPSIEPRKKIPDAELLLELEIQHLEVLAFSLYFYVGTCRNQMSEPSEPGSWINFKIQFAEGKKMFWEKFSSLQFILKVIFHFL